MIIVGKFAIQEIGSAIITTLMSGKDHHGKAVVLKTIDPDLMRRIALGALAAASGESIWVAGETIEKHPEEVLPFIRTIYPR